jgi:hypothetical protein
MKKEEYLEKLRVLQSNIDYISQQLKELREGAGELMKEPAKSLEDYKGYVPIELLNDFIEDARRSLRIKDDIILIEDGKARVLAVDTDAQDYTLSNSLGESLNVMIVRVVDEHENFYL